MPRSDYLPTGEYFTCFLDFSRIANISLCMLNLNLISIISSLLAFISAALYSQIPSETLDVTVHYYDNEPFAYKSKSGKLEGIEIDIFSAFERWAEDRKGIRINPNFVPYSVFGNAYRRVKSEIGGNHIGMATVTITESRRKEVDFSSPYLRNRSILISGGYAPMLHNIEEIGQKFKGMTALAVQSSIHEELLKNIRANYFPDMNIEYRNSITDIIDIIARNEGYFGYVDIVSYWAYVSSKSDGYVKIQRAAGMDQEYIGFIFPKGQSRLKELFNEFMDAGFGFISSKTYEKIILSYLGPEMLKYVDVGRND